MGWYRNYSHLMRDGSIHRNELSQKDRRYCDQFNPGDNAIRAWEIAENKIRDEHRRLELKKSIEFYRDYDLESLDKGSLLNDLDLVLGLTYWNLDFGEDPLLQDLDILRMGGGKVAWYAAINAYRNNWGNSGVTQKREVLKMYREQVAVELAQNVFENGWEETDVIKDEWVHQLSGGQVGDLLRMRGVIGDFMEVSSEQSSFEEGI